MSPIRIATFNAENLFKRPAAMLYESWSTGRQVPQDFAELSSLIAQDVYDATTKQRLCSTIPALPVTSIRCPTEE